VYSKELEDVLEFDEYSTFVRRWNLLRYKLSESIKFTSLGERNTAIYFLRAAQFDLSALVTLVEDTSSRIVSVLQCKVEKPIVTTLMSKMQLVFVIIFIILLILLIRVSNVMKLFKKKKPQKFL
jgi:hypothetical protein